MSRPEEADHKSFEAVASDLAALCADAIENDSLDSVPDDSLGQAFASILRLFAAKVQAGPAPNPFGRNSGVTPTDVAIGCTAMLDAARLAVFELAAWQNLSGLGRATAKNIEDSNSEKLS